jgi:transcription elongation GreA/GreB family factor
MSRTVLETRTRLKTALHAARAARLGRERIQGVAHGCTPERIRLLALLILGASGRGGELIYAVAAGYGSEVTIEDLDTGEWFRHRLMTADAMDLEAGHISVDSPLGAALLGEHEGKVVRVQTPHGTRSVCIARLETLPAFLDRLEREERSSQPVQKRALAS